MHWELSPVFVYESMLSARRWQVYAGRSAFVLTLLAGMAIVWLGRANPPRPPGRFSSQLQQMAKVGESFFYTLTALQISLVLLAAPAAAAGAICIDRTRGSLLHTMVTDLSDTEIVLGKLGSRVVPVFGLIVCTVPVVALAGLLGGIDFGALAGAFVVSMALALLGGAGTLAASVWAKKTHEVLMIVYVIESLWLLALPTWWGWTGAYKIIPPPLWFQHLNPYTLVFAPYSAPGSANAGSYVIFAGSAITISVLFSAVTIARLRRAVVEESGRIERGRRRRGRSARRLFAWLPGPSLDGNPVLWREWHGNRPSRVARCLWAILFGLTWGLAAWGTYDFLVNGVHLGPNALVQGLVLQVVFGLLMLSATAPTALAEERASGSIDVLLATPLPTSAIVAGKCFGLFPVVLGLALLPLYTGIFVAATAPSVPVSALAPRMSQPTFPLTLEDRIFSALLCPADFLASAAVIVSLGVALATWIPRLGRAAACSVIAFVGSGLGWLILVQSVLVPALRYHASWRQRAAAQEYQALEYQVQNMLMSLSPIAGPIDPLEVLVFPFVRREGVWSGLAFVVVVKMSIAAILFRLTVTTFDRCLGRVPERAEFLGDGKRKFSAKL